MPGETRTLIGDLVHPDVMAALVEKKLVDKMVFSPLATIDTTLAGRPGDTIVMPYFTYIGDASVLGEASTLSVAKLGTSTTSVTIHKLAQGIEISDEAVLSGYGDPLGEASDQIVLSIASGMDNELLSVLSGISAAMTADASGSIIVPDDLCDALELFGEDVDGEKVALVSPAFYTKLRKTTNWLPASEIAADRLVRGSVGESNGCQIIVSNKLTATGNVYIVKPGALRIFLKRDTLIETSRNIITFCTTITASKHFACYLYDASKAIKLVAGEGGGV